MKRSLVLILSMLLSLTVTVGCKGEGKAPAQENATAEQGNSLEVSGQAFDQAIKADPKIHVLDVRTPEEYQEFHVKGAVLVPLQDIMAMGDRISEKIPFGKSDKFFVICRSGNRSFTATRVLRSMGYENAVSVQGGTVGFVNMGNSCDTALLSCQN